MRAPEVTTRQRPAHQSRAVGPFAVLGRTFFVECSNEELLCIVSQGYADLAVDEDESDSTVYRIEQTFPAWYPYGWSVWRDDELIAPETLRSFVLTLILSDFARHTAADSTTLVVLNGLALARNDRALLFAVDSIADDEAGNDEPIDLAPLAVAAMHRGWALVALDIVPIDTSTGTPRAAAFHRPFAVEPNTGLAAVLGTSNQDPLARVSRIGALAGAAQLIALVAVRPALGGATRMEAASASAVLRTLTLQLAATKDVRRRSFRQLASLVEKLPGFELRLSEHDAALTAVERLS